MSWGDCKAGAGRFVSLKQDGDQVRLVVVGEPLVKEAVDKKGNTRKRVFLSVATVEDLKKAAELGKGESLNCSILGVNITTAEVLAEVLKANPDKFKLSENLVGKALVRITRKGAAADIATKYQVELLAKLSPAEVKALARMTPANLEEVDFKNNN